MSTVTPVPETLLKKRRDNAENREKLLKERTERKKASVQDYHRVYFTAGQDWARQGKAEHRHILGKEQARR
jgi:hypothetical protein